MTLLSLEYESDRLIFVAGTFIGPFFTNLRERFALVAFGFACLFTKCEVESISVTDIFFASFDSTTAPPLTALRVVPDFVFTSASGRLPLTLCRAGVDVLVAVIFCCFFATSLFDDCLSLLLAAVAFFGDTDFFCAADFFGVAEAFDTEAFFDTTDFTPDELCFVTFDERFGFNSRP